MKYRNDEDVKNISYINNDFPSIWQELLELIPKLTNKWNPAEANESDPLAVLLKLLAIYADKLNYNIDKRILEAFPVSLTQLRSAYNVYDMLGYTPKWYQSAITTVNFTYNEKLNIFDDDTVVKAVLPKLTQICDSDVSIVYTTLQDLEITKDTPLGKSFSILAMQGTVNDYSINGSPYINANNLDEDNKIYFTETNVAQNGVFISSTREFNEYVPEIGSLLGDWRSVDNIYQVEEFDKAFKFGIDPASGSCYVQFPNSISNLIGPGLYVKYNLSDGLEGNIKSNTLSRFFDENVKFTITYSSTDATETDVNTTANIYLTIANLSATSNGVNPETIDSMYVNYQKVKNVFSTLVTLLDYENYLYTYTQADGSHIVSNIKASDRTNDLYFNYKVRSLNRNGESIILENVGNSISAYNIRFYPLQAVNNINSDRSFLNTFNFVDSSWNYLCEDALVNAKTINHDVMANGKPIRVDYDLVGEIYLTEKVSKQVANQIMDKVRSALRLRLNAREMSFGTIVPYREVLDTIRDADNRIDYIALQPIQYISKVNIDNNNLAGSDLLKDEEAIRRNILAGNLPWANYDTDFNYALNQVTADNGIGTVPGGTTVTISPYIEVKDLDKTLFELESNEYLSLFAPLYKDELTYTNYLYYRTKNITNISKDTLVKLNTDQFIYFYETRDDWASDSAVIGLNSSAVLKENDVVKFNFDYTYTPSNTATSLNQGKSISKMEKMQGTLTPAADATNIQFFTNSTKLLNLIGTTSSKGRIIQYTLNLSEYFLFKVSGSSSFTLFGEGTTIKFTNADWSFINEYKLSDYLDALSSVSLDWEAITEGYTSSTSYLNDLWLPSPDYTTIATLDGSNVTYQVNQILTFSEGCQFRYTLREGTELLPFEDVDWFVTYSPATPTGIKHSDPTHIFNASPVNTDATTHYDLQYKQPNEEWTNIPQLPETTDYWGGLLRLDADISKDSPINLVTTDAANMVNHNQVINLYYSNNSHPFSSCTLEISPQIITSGTFVEYEVPTGSQLSYYAYNTHSVGEHTDYFTYLPRRDITNYILASGTAEADVDYYDLTINTVSVVVGETDVSSYYTYNSGTHIYTEASGTAEADVDYYDLTINTVSVVVGETIVSSYYYVTPSYEYTYKNDLNSNSYIAIIPCIIDDTSTSGVTFTLGSNNQSDFISHYLPNPDEQNGEKIMFIGLQYQSVLKYTTGDDDALVMLGNPVLVKADNNYGIYKYTGTGLPLKIKDQVIQEFTENFNYTYIPSEEDLIDTTKPLSGESYLNSNNVFNRYCIARLNTLNIGTENTLNESPNVPLLSNLRISNLSIK